MATKKQIEIAEDGTPTGLIIFTFDDGSTQTFDASKCNDSILTRLYMHGASQKIGDSYAGAASSGVDPVAFAKEAVKDTIAQLYAGDWRAAGTGGAARVPDLALALSRIPAIGKTLDECVAFVETLDKDQTKAWKAKAKVAAELLRISAERKAEQARRAAEKLANLTKGEAGEGESAGEAEDDDLNFEVPAKEDGAEVAPAAPTA